MTACVFLWLWCVFITHTLIFLHVLESCICNQVEVNSWKFLQMKLSAFKLPAVTVLKQYNQGGRSGEWDVFRHIYCDYMRSDIKGKIPPKLSVFRKYLHLKEDILRDVLLCFSQWFGAAWRWDQLWQKYEYYVSDHFNTSYKRALRSLLTCPSDLLHCTEEFWIKEEKTFMHQTHDDLMVWADEWVMHLLHDEAVRC